MILKRSFLIKSILIFFIIYDFSFIAFPSFTSGRFALLIIFSHSICNKNIKIGRNIIYFLVILFILFTASLIQFISSNDFMQSSRLLWFALYSIVTPYLLLKYFKSLDEFVWSFLLVTSLQSIIAINSFFNPIVKQRIISTIVVGGNDLEEAIYRAIGFSGASGAALSIIQFCGVFSGLILLKYFYHSKLRVVVIWLCITCCLLSTLIIGRTGLICSLLAILVYFFSKFNLKNALTFFIIVMVVSQINFISILEDQASGIQGFNVEFFLNWVQEGFAVRNNYTANTIAKMPIPPLSLKTILGTGEVYNTSTLSNASGNDSGYIQTYYSLGFLLTIVFYCSYFFFLFKETRNKNLFLLFSLIFIMFIIEYKEPFIFKYSLPFFILSLIFLYNKREKIEPEISV